MYGVTDGPVIRPMVVIDSPSRRLEMVQDVLERKLTLAVAAAAHCVSARDRAKAGRAVAQPRGSDTARRVLAPAGLAT